MSKLENGSTVHARVLGFLPGHKVVLDVDGEALVAWSDLPLVYGKWVTAVVDRAGEALRLRVQRDAVDPDSRPEAGVPAGTPESDALDQLIARTATELGIAIEPRLFRDVRKQLRQIQPELQRGPVSLRDLEPHVLRILAARSRGLPPSARAWADIRMGSEARMGTALGRLIESLEEAATRGRGKLPQELGEQAARLHEFFVDLDHASMASQLHVAVRRCGYDHEAALSRAGFTSWPRAADAPETDLKGALLVTCAALQRLSEEDLLRQSEPCRLGLERAIAWCAQALDILEGLQVQNLPSAGGPEDILSFQLPVRRRGRVGTLHLILSENRSRFWLELKGLETIHGDMLHRPGSHEAQLKLPSQAKTWKLDTMSCERRGLTVDVQHLAPNAPVAHVDLAI